MRGNQNPAQARFILYPYCFAATNWKASAIKFFAQTLSISKTGYEITLRLEWLGKYFLPLTQTKEHICTAIDRYSCSFVKKLCNYVAIVVGITGKLSIIIQLSDTQSPNWGTFDVFKKLSATRCGQSLIWRMTKRGSSHQCSVDPSKPCALPPDCEVTVDQPNTEPSSSSIMFLPYLPGMSKQKYIAWFTTYKL